MTDSSSASGQGEQIEPPATDRRSLHPFVRAARIVATGAAALAALYGLWILASYWHRGG